MSRKLQDDLAYPPRAMKADRAAAYLDMSRSKFLELVGGGRLPKPEIIDGIRVWDRLALDAAFGDFPERREGDPPLLSALHAGTKARVRSLSAILLHEHHTG
jgi:hypothetical protein